MSLGECFWRKDMQKWVSGGRGHVGEGECPMEGLDSCRRQDTKYNTGGEAGVWEGFKTNFPTSLLRAGPASCPLGVSPICFKNK